MASKARRNTGGRRVGGALHDFLQCPWYRVRNAWSVPGCGGRALGRGQGLAAAIVISFVHLIDVGGDRVIISLRVLRVDKLKRCQDTPLNRAFAESRRSRLGEWERQEEENCAGKAVFSTIFAMDRKLQCELWHWSLPAAHVYMLPTYTPCPYKKSDIRKAHVLSFHIGNPVDSPNVARLRTGSYCQPAERRSPLDMPTAHQNSATCEDQFDGCAQREQLLNRNRGISGLTFQLPTIIREEQGEGHVAAM